MHGPIRDRLEDLLAADRERRYSGDIDGHLTTCSKCAAELEGMRGQARELASLRAPEDVEPAAGFYARVLQRIEERQGNSFWAVFVDATYARRIAIASLTVMLALGGYVATQDAHARSPQSLMAYTEGTHYDAPVMGDTSQRRDAVLENFETYHLSNAEGQIR